MLRFDLGGSAKAGEGEGEGKGKDEEDRKGKGKVKGSAGGDEAEAEAEGLRGEREGAGEGGRRGLKFASGVNLEQAATKVVALRRCRSETGTLEARLGFLLPFCTYEVRISTAQLVEEFPDSDKVSVDSSKCIHVDAKSDTVSLRGVDSEGVPLILELNTIRESVELAEKLLVSDEKKNASVTIVVKAKVFHKHQGTPLLKDGIRRIAKRRDLQTDADTDFEGFDSPPRSPTQN